MFLLLLWLCALVASKTIISEAAHNECAIEKFNRHFDVPSRFVVLTNLPVIGKEAKLMLFCFVDRSEIVFNSMFLNHFFVSPKAGIAEWEGDGNVAVRLKTTCTEEQSPVAWAALQAAQILVSEMREKFEKSENFVGATAGQSGR